MRFVSTSSSSFQSPGPSSDRAILRGSMLLDLSKIRSAHERYEHTVDPKLFAGEQDAFVVVRPVSLGFDVFKDKAQFRLAGGVQTVLELPCSRCLESFALPVDAAFD